NLLTLVNDTDNTYSLHNKKPLLGGLFNKRPQFKYCKNHEFDVCNWLIPAESSKLYCRACELNHIVPNLTDPDHIRQWRLIEMAKHRLIYTLLQLRLPLVSKVQDVVKGLSFDFLTDINPNQRVL